MSVSNVSIVVDELAEDCLEVVVVLGQEHEVSVEVKEAHAHQALQIALVILVVVSLAEFLHVGHLLQVSCDGGQQRLLFLRSLHNWFWLLVRLLLVLASFLVEF